MFNADAFINEAVEDLKKKIQGNAIIACSGGVDSTVAAVLVSRAIGDRLLTIYVNTGFMRKGEDEEVRKMLTDLDVNFQIIDASEEFYASDH